MTTPHQFYCGNAGGNPTTYNNFQYNMLETSPNATHICLLTYVSNTTIQPQSNCFLPTAQSQLTDDVEGDMEEFDECGIPAAAGNGGALSMAAGSLVLSVAMLLNFITS